MTEPERLIHELQVHQLELEMQNRELRETQQLLEESRNRYADLYDFAPVGYCALDSGGHIREANLTAAALLGSERAALIGRSLSSLVVQEDRHLLRAHLERCLNARERVTVELTFNGRESATALQLVSAPLYDPHGRVSGCRTVLTDQSRLRLLSQASELLSASFDYRLTFAQVAAMVVPLFADLCIVDAVEHSGGLERIAVSCGGPLGAQLAASLKRAAPPVEGDSPLAESLRSAHPVLLAECVPQALAAAIDGLRHQSLADDIGAHSIMWVPMVARGRARGVLTFANRYSGRRYARQDLAFAQDLAARTAMALDNARLYEEAHKAIRAREDVLSIVSHDLKNPLGTILMSIDLLLQKWPLDHDRFQQRLDAIRRSALNMDRLANDLLDLSSIEAGHLSIDTREHGVRELLNDAAEAIATVAREKALQVQVKAPPSDLCVVCDRQRVLQVMANLTGNAIKFTPRGGSLMLSAAPDGARTRFAVRDSGPGIAAPVLRNLFQRYWQAKETASKGRGLGLFIAKGIIEAQGGSIWAESQVGAGTTIYFTLPSQVLTSYNSQTGQTSQNGYT